MTSMTSLIFTLVFFTSVKCQTLTDEEEFMQTLSSSIYIYLSALREEGLLLETDCRTITTDCIITMSVMTILIFAIVFLTCVESLFPRAAAAPECRPWSSATASLLTLLCWRQWGQEALRRQREETLDGPLQEEVQALEL
ncbi:hypothetical protein GJAV_G00275630 [Gymnothorax javanicus]|nr:hypothetical protein GJAV_G00275630 [Gymnothorax javanicus]